jgi:hypothetical protein
MDELVNEMFAGGVVLFVLCALFVVSMVAGVISALWAGNVLKRERPDVWDSVKQRPMTERTIRSDFRSVWFWISGEYRRLGNQKVAVAGRVYNICYFVLWGVMLATAAWLIWLNLKTA